MGEVIAGNELREVCDILSAEYYGQRASGGFSTSAGATRNSLRTWRCLHSN